MKTRDTAHAARKRLVTGIVILASTFFYAFAGTCGLVGRLVARGSAMLLGQTGSTLLAITMLLIGLALVIPVGAAGRFVRWVANGREARVRGVVQEMKAAVSKSELRQIAEALRALAKEDGGGVPEPIAPAPGEPVPVPPADRMRLDDVRGGLKQLGWKPYEYEPLVKAMDPRQPVETLIRGAIKALSGKSQTGARTN